MPDRALLVLWRLRMPCEVARSSQISAHRLVEACSPRNSSSTCNEGLRIKLYDFSSLFSNLATRGMSGCSRHTSIPDS